jgi:hypothetical protein
MAAVPVEESWQDGDGGLANSPNFRRQRSSLLPSFAIRLWLFFTFTQQKQLLYTVHIHAALGSGGPRWWPLNVAVAMSEMTKCRWRIPWQAATATADICGQTVALHLQLRTVCGGSVATAAFVVLDSEYCICMFAHIRFSYLYSAFIYIRSFSHQIIVKMIIFGLIRPQFKLP